MILKEIDLKIEHPGLYGLSGVNGSGKTTLLKLLKKFLNRQKEKSYTINWILKISGMLIAVVLYLKI